MKAKLKICFGSKSNLNQLDNNSILVTDCEMKIAKSVNNIGINMDSGTTMVTKINIIIS